MRTVLSPIARCREIAGLAPDELVIGVTPDSTHERMLRKYRRPRCSAAFVRVMIVADLRAALKAGATREAADLLIVLRRLLSFGEPVMASRANRSGRRFRAGLLGLARAPMRASQRASATGSGDAVILPFAVR